MKIIILEDYNGKFESKHFDDPVGSGLNKSLLKEYFDEYGFNVEIKNFAEINFYTIKPSNDKIYIYTSSEDKGYHYKDFIEDIILGIEQCGGIVIPNFKFLRAHNNKLFAEILRANYFPDNESGIKSYCFGSLNEFKEVENKFNNKYVIKKPYGAKSRGVYLANGINEAVKIIKKISIVRNPYLNFKEIYRKYKYKGYKPVTKYRRKFIVQEFVSGLNNDWKVLIFWNKAYVLYRQNRENDFRASGSGKFLFSIDNIPKGLLDYAYHLYRSFDVPFISLDIAHKKGSFYMIEFQALFFGKTTIEESPFHFEYIGSKWELVEGKAFLEKEYVNSIVNYIRSKYE